MEARKTVDDVGGAGHMDSLRVNQEAYSSLALWSIQKREQILFAEEI